MLQNPGIIKSKRLFLLGMLVCIAALLVVSCDLKSPTPEVMVTPDPVIIAKYRDSDTKPVDGIDQYACVAESDNLFTCPFAPSGNTVTLLNVPSGVTPYFAPIPDGDIKQLTLLTPEGFKCFDTVVGNLTFYDNLTLKIKSTFESPVTIKLDYTYADLAKVKACGSDLPVNEVWQDIVPAYLFFSPDSSTSYSWKPFSNYTVEPLTYDDKAAPTMIAGTITITFTFWGDRPMAIGSPKE